MNEFSIFRFINESLDSKFDMIRNTDLENIVNSNFSDKIFSGHTAAFQSPHMKTSGYSVLRFMGKPLKQIEYHIHNDFAQPGTVTSPDRRSMLHSLKIIHDDASDQINTHKRSIYIHATNSEQYEKYLSLGKRLAISHNQKLKELGIQPFTTNRELSGPAFVIREESEYMDVMGRKFKHIDEQINELR